jgi:hypothetical protein
MRFRRSLCLLLALSLCACLTPYKKADEAEKQPLKNMVGDTAFQAFLGRLRIAVQRKDAPMIASLMTSDFGYTMDEGAQPGVHIFSYWDQNQLWPVLSHLLDQKFVPLDLYMVSPPAMALDPNYAGPRCGMRMVGGSWKFAYFLPN